MDPVETCYELAGWCGVSPHGLTLRELTWMARGRDRRTREHNAALSSLVWGEIKDVQTYILEGRVDGKGRVGKPPPMTPEVARYCEAIKRNGGKFVMPEDVERILDGTSPESS